MKRRSKNIKSKANNNGSNPVVTQHIEQSKSSSFALFKEFLKDNLVFISFLQLICAIIVIVLPSNREKITIEPNTLITEDSVVLSSLEEIECIKKEINEEVKILKEGFILGDDTNIDNKDIPVIKSFNRSVQKLVSYQSVHESTDFQGNSLNESCHLAQENIAERIKYDDFLKTVLNGITKLFEMPFIKEDNDYSILELAQCTITNQATEWLYNDSIRNYLVRTKLKLAQTENDSVIFNKALDPLVDYKKDPQNYYVKKNLYRHLNSINRIIRN